MFGHKKKTVNLLKARSFFRRRARVKASAADERPVRFAKPADKRGPVHFVSLALVAIFVVGAVLSLITLPFVIAGLSGYRHAAVGRAALLSAEDAVSRLDLDAAVTQIDAATEAFKAAAADLNRLAPLSWVPSLDQKLRVASAAIDSGVLATGAARDALVVGRDMTAILRQSTGLPFSTGGIINGQPGMIQDLNPAERRRLLATLADNAPRLRDAASRIETSLQGFEDLSKDPSAAPYLGQLASIEKKLKDVHEALVAATPIAELVPRVFGYPEQRNYLFILQNNTELRPTGGFLSMVGLIEIKDGDLAAPVAMDDVYAYDGPAERTERPIAPEPFRRYVGVEHWYLRDANWSPDFPTAAGTISQFFRDEYAARFGKPAPRIDGIIAITPRPAQDLLRVIGPITVDGRKFDAANLVDELEFQVEQGFAQQGIPKEERKDIVERLVQQVVEKVRGFTLPQYLGLSGLVEHNFATGDIQLYSTDLTLQGLILERDWGGRLHAVDGDYLAAVDANLASLKTDAVMKRSVKYAIEPDQSKGYVASAALTYTNNGGFSWKMTRYRTYARVYVPAGAELLGVDGAMYDDKLKNPSRKPGTADVGDENGRRWFGAFISVEPGETKTLTFRYRLSPRTVALINQGSYRLFVEKQPGVPDAGLTLDLDFGKKLAGAEPAENPQEFGDSRYYLVSDLKLDRQFSVTFK